MEVYHYWYSLKQDEAIEDTAMGGRDFRNYVLIKGGEKEYTECRKTFDVPFGKWDDYSF